MLTLSRQEVTLKLRTNQVSLKMTGSDALCGALFAHLHRDAR
jgi:hypothetical protein